MAKVLQFILSTITLIPIVSSTTYAQQGSKTEEGKASVYSDKFEGKKTASGDKFEQNELTAASKTKPLGTKVKVTNKVTGESTTVKITDRGPYVKGRVIDLSKAAAKEIKMPEDGLAPVKVQEVK
jgi:rare lipoprotein A